MPKITVAIPVYNVKSYLEKCVRSVLDQTERDFELLLIDDGSTDGSGELCDHLARQDTRIRVIHQENRGLGGARNTGIEAALGEWILFPDSDDWLEPETLERALRAGERAGADIAAFAFRTVDEAGRELHVFREDLPVDVGLDVAARREVLLAAPSAWCRLYKIALFRETGVRYPPRVWYEDVRTTLKLLPSCKRSVYTDYVGYNYLQRAGSIMNNLNLARNREILDAFDDILDWYRKQGLFDQYKDELRHLTLVHVYLTASVRVLRQDPRHPLLEEFQAYLLREFPDYKEDVYHSRLTRNQRLALDLLDSGRVSLLHWIFRLKDALGRGRS
ncbi:glycosyltransferase family 2 protein [Acutalibacter sp. 1XD8-33]|uniref:glycosyltransferase family 2 protein n=1 Tax=Acutalibacter sp. 1XD8-33 TaxID=2320081 RepID=UPI000EA2F5CA|nr:glycosyltransferase family 2 protein [Acutalibacter sp. 1XD8-33]RKJ40538.1 glycosyltransferase family 2 protein [Acutalibacter sp. 1XD8-33]